jgi:hypothetical protein
MRFPSDRLHGFSQRSCPIQAAGPAARLWASRGRLAELDLHVANGDAAVEAEDAVDAAHVIAAPLQHLLQLARLLKADL